MPYPLPGDLSDPGIEPTSLMSPAFSRRALYRYLHLKKQSMETSLKIMQVLKIAVKDVKAVIIHTLKFIKENMLKVNEKRGNHSEKQK